MFYGSQERKAWIGVKEIEWLCVCISVTLSAAVKQSDSMMAKGLGLSSVNYSCPSSRGPLCDPTQ